jgi:pyruvate formate lyase activating enzyme
MKPPTGTLFDIRRFSIHDGPGIRTTVFFKGCPLRCAWCHNPESQRAGLQLLLRPSRCIQCGACQAACPQQAIGQPQTDCLPMDREACQVCGACVEACLSDARQLVGRRYGVEEVMAVVRRDRVFYEQSDGGVTFSGGEPLAQPRFLLALLQAARAAGFHTAVDTCGEAPWAAFAGLLPYTDLFLYDVKLLDHQRHQQWTGRPNQRILDNLRRLSAAGVRLVLRIPLVPGVNDDEATLQGLARLASELPGVQRVDLLPFHNSAGPKYSGLGQPSPLDGVPALPLERLHSLSACFAPYSVPVQIGG